MHITFLNTFNKFDSIFASVKSITFEHFHNDCILENDAEPAAPPPSHFPQENTLGPISGLNHNKCSIY